MRIQGSLLNVEAPQASRRETGIRAFLGTRMGRLTWHALLGFIMGYFFLHPVSMLIFRLLDVAQDHPASHSGGHAAFAPVLHSFSAEMAAMGIVFGIVGAIISSMYGYQGATIAFQRDNLARQLDLNHNYRRSILQQTALLKQKNAELDELRLAQRRTTLFMVHDFKTHLACIRGFSELLLDRSRALGDLEGASDLERIRRQAHRMFAAVNDLLDFARLDEKLEIRWETVDPAALFQQTIADFSAYSHLASIQAGPGHLLCPRIAADSRLLSRVLGNLVFNALHHGKESTTVVLDAHVADGSQNVLFSCRDDGEGIPPDRLATIFEEFQSGGAEFSGSSGLGLAFCKAAVEAMGGKIWCESNEANGTCFFFTLPQSGGGLP